MKHSTKLLYFIFILGFTVLISTSIYLGKTNDVLTTKDNKSTMEDTNKKPKSNKLNKNKKVPKPITGLLIGYDESEQLTDVLMVINFNPKNNELKLLSMPRDLYIDFTEEPYKTIKENVSLSKISYCKLTETYGYFGKDKEALDGLKDVVSEVLGVEIDFMASINISAFREMVDTVGGVEFDVPDNIWETPCSKTGLKKGIQLLDGKKAEILVRERKTYKRGDFQRMEVQQQFLTSLMNKVLEIEDWSKVMEIMETIYTYVKTNLTFLDAMEYSEYIKNINKQQLLRSENRKTIPSYGTRIKGKWFQEWKKDEVQEFVNKFLNENQLEEKEEYDEQYYDE